MTTWQVQTIDQLARVVGGGTPATRVPSYWGGGIPWFTPAEIASEGSGVVSRSERTISPAGLKNSGARLLPEGSVLVTSRASVGHTAVSGSAVATNQGFTSLIPYDPRSTWFLYYWVQQNRRELESRAAGSTFVEISARKVGTIEIAAPPLDEQELIARTIRDADELVVALSRLLAKKFAVRQGLLNDLLTGSVRIPGYSAPWQSIRLGDHVRYLKSTALSRAQLDQQSATKYLHYGDIHGSSGSVLDAAVADMPRMPDAFLSTAELLEVGDVVFADASEDLEGVGRSLEVSTVPTQGLVAGLHTIAARFDKRVLADGFKANLQFIPAFRAQLSRLASGTKVASTTRSQLSSIELLVPDLDEQRAITQVLRDADIELAAIARRHASARSVKQGMMQELLTGRTRLRGGEPV